MLVGGGHFNALNIGVAGFYSVICNVYAVLRLLRHYSEAEIVRKKYA